MAVSVDRVYQTVLTIVHKEGGKYLLPNGQTYITPQEFNLLANQAQIEIFESYFHDLDLHLELQRHDDDYADTVRNLQEKIRVFDTLGANLTENDQDVFEYPSDFYRLGRVTLNNRIADEVSNKDVAYIQRSPLTSPTRTQPVYVRRAGGVLIYPSLLAQSDIVNMHYVKTPAMVVWSGDGVNGTFNTATSIDFELHPSEFPELVVKILSYVGVLIRRQDVSQFAQTEEQILDQEKKQ